MAGCRCWSSQERLWRPLSNCGARIYDLMLHPCLHKSVVTPSASALSCLLIVQLRILGRSGSDVGPLRLHLKSRSVRTLDSQCGFTNETKEQKNTHPASPLCVNKSPSSLQLNSCLSVGRNEWNCTLRPTNAPPFLLSAHDKVTAAC